MKYQILNHKDRTISIVLVERLVEPDYTAVVCGFSITMPGDKFNFVKGVNLAKERAERIIKQNKLMGYQAQQVAFVCNPFVNLELMDNLMQTAKTIIKQYVDDILPQRKTNKKSILYKVSYPFNPNKKSKYVVQ